MALLLNSPPHTKKPHLLLHHSQSHQQPTHRNFSIKFQDPSSDKSPKPTEETTSSTVKKSSSSTLGFGSSISSPVTTKKKGKKERASIIRREPIQKPSFATSKPEETGSQEFQKNESAFLLAWLGLGGIILVEGILLAASGFLPEAWDNFFVKYLYPSFTPTVFLFVGGTVTYGVLKYLQNEKFNSEN